MQGSCHSPACCQSCRTRRGGCSKRSTQWAAWRWAPPSGSTLLLPITMHAFMQWPHIHHHRAWSEELQPAAWLGCWGLQERAGAFGAMLTVHTDCMVPVSACALRHSLACSVQLQFSAWCQSRRRQRIHVTTGGTCRESLSIALLLDPLFAHKSMRQVPMQGDGGAAGTLRDCAVSLCHIMRRQRWLLTSLLAVGGRCTAADIPSAGPAASGTAVGRLCRGVQGAPALSLHWRTSGTAIGACVKAPVCAHLWVLLLLRNEFIFA